MVNVIEYEIKWYLFNRVAILTQFVDMTMPANIAMIHEMNQLLAVSPHAKIPVIVVTHLNKTRNGLNQVVTMFREERSEKWGYTVVVGARGGIRFIAQVIVKLAWVQMSLTDTVEEAYAILRHHDPTLPPLDY